MASSSSRRSAALSRRQAMGVMWRLRSSRRPGGAGRPTSCSTPVWSATRRWYEGIHLIVSGFDLCSPSRVSNIAPVLMEPDHLPLAQSRMVRALACAAGALLVVWLIGGDGLAARASPPVDEPVRAELIAEPQAIAAGQPFWVGVRLRIKEGWHVYWRNPGDSGEAPTITWQLPPAFAASPIAWPTPQKIPIAHLVNFGYAGETMLLTQIAPPAVLSDAGRVDINADVTWLVCETECIPGEAKLALSLPLARGGSETIDAGTAAVFVAARGALPHPSPWRAHMALDRDWVRLAVDAQALATAAVRAAYFFPNAETLVRHAAPQELSMVQGGLRLRLERSALSSGAPSDAGGVLLLEEGEGSKTTRHAVELANVEISEAPLAREGASLMAVLEAATLALLGGVILNLMPCVFPVLSIKVLALIGEVGASRRHLRQHGLAYTTGVLIAFAALGFALVGMRAAGAEVGWGFQLQSPV